MKNQIVSLLLVCVSVGLYAQNSSACNSICKKIAEESHVAPTTVYGWDYVLKGYGGNWVIQSGTPARFNSWLEELGHPVRRGISDVEYSAAILRFCKIIKNPSPYSFKYAVEYTPECEGKAFATFK